MKTSLALIALSLASAWAFVAQQPTFRRSTLQLGATPSEEDLQKTRAVILEFMNMQEGVEPPPPPPPPPAPKEDAPKKKKKTKEAVAEE